MNSSACWLIVSHEPWRQRVSWFGRLRTNCIRCARLGRTTDQSIPAESIATHQRLLVEVASDGQPVVVPASPGATDQDVPANPMDIPVALVPIELEPSFDGPSYLLEVFLESNCGLATQRGYLRFVAQMADLAGEFLRSDQLRSLRRKQDLAAKVDAAVVALHRTENRRVLEAAIVDNAVDIFGFDRVGLVQSKGDQLIAVSHVETIDSRSAAAKQLRDAASVELDDDGCRWFEAQQDPSFDVGDSELVNRAVVTDALNPQRQLVCMQVADVQAITADYRDELIRYMQHADMAIENAIASGSLLGKHLFKTTFLHGQDCGVKRRNRAIISTVLTLVVLLVLSFPVPLMVSSPATIRPAQVQTITAPRDAVVDQIHVRHGQTVTAGELLVTLADPDLEEQMTALVGRRAVLIQQKSQWTDALVDTAAHQFDRMEQVQGESRLVDEEIRSIDEQIVILKRAESSMQIRATRRHG